MVAQEGLDGRSTRAKFLFGQPLPRRDGPGFGRQRRIGHDELGVELLIGPQPFAHGAGAVRAVEAERARHDRFVADAAFQAGGEGAVEFVAPLAVGVAFGSAGAFAVAGLRAVAMARVVVAAFAAAVLAAVAAIAGKNARQRPSFAQTHGELQRIGQPALYSLADDDAVDHRFDVVRFARGQRRDFVEVEYFAVDAGTRQASLADSSQGVVVRAAAAANQRRQDHDSRSLRQTHQGILNLLLRLLANRAAALVAQWLAESGEEQPQIVVHLGDGGHGAPRVAAARALVDAQRGGEAFDQIDVGPLQLVEKLASIDRQALDVLPLPLGVERIERQAAFAGTAGPGDDDELAVGDVEVDVLEIVYARAANADEAGGTIVLVGAVRVGAVIVGAALVRMRLICAGERRG